MARRARPRRDCGGEATALEGGVDQGAERRVYHVWPEPPPTGDVDQALVDQVLVDEAEQETEVVTTGGTTVGVGRQSAGSGVGRCSRSRVARRWSTLPKAISTARRRSSSPRMSLRISRMSLRSSAWPPEICTLKAMTAATMVPMIHGASRLGTWAGYHRPRNSRRADEPAPSKRRERHSRIDPRVGARIRLRSRDVPGQNSRQPPLAVVLELRVHERRRPAARLAAGGSISRPAAGPAAATNSTPRRTSRESPGRRCPSRRARAWRGP